MFIEMKRDDPRPAYRQIADEVLRAVAVGVLKAGEPLPATRQVASDLKLNPNTVQHAYRTLLQEGIIEMRRGLRAFGADGPRGARQHPLDGWRDNADRGLPET